MRSTQQDLGDGPVTKPTREPVEKPEPRPKQPPVATPAPAPRPVPRPTTPPPPPEEPPDRGPFQKPVPGGRKPPEPPLPTTLPGPIGDRWKALGGMAWGRPTGPVESRPGGGKAAVFELALNRYAAIMWRQETGALVVSSTLWPAYARMGRTLGLPTAEEQGTHDRVGVFQRFDNGLIVWHPTLGAFAVVGAINTTYLKAAGVGGTLFGYPLSDQRQQPDGRGWVQEFRNLDDGGEGTIYWTADHGAHAVHGAIRDAYRGYRGLASLGYPTTDELDAAAPGRWQRFEGGDLIWHPDTGAHDVHGDIGAAYHRLGGSNWGFPTTDVTRTPDGVGRFVHVRGPSGDERSIYWTPQTGAQPVFGLFRQRWSELGWERSSLGYPTGPEEPLAGQPGGSVRQSYQHGQMLYRSDLGVAVADPVDFFHDFGKGSELQGWVRVRMHSDGRLEYSGHQRATREHSYSFGIQVGVTNDVVGVANAWEGRVHGTFESGSRNAEWSEQAFSPAVQASFWDLAVGRMTHTRHMDKSLGWVSGVLESGLKFLIGSGAEFVLGPAGSCLILVGTLAVTVATGGNVQGGLRVIDGTLWMAGPGGTFVALVAEGINQLATDERRPNDEEWRAAQLVFGPHLPDRDDIRITDAVGGNNRPFVYKRFDGKVTINMGTWHDEPMAMYEGEPIDPKDATKGVYSRGEKFIHEMTHVWQVENGSDLLLVAKGMAKVFGEDYDYTLGEDFEDYNLEQQAAIVQHWFRRHYTPFRTADDFGLSSANATNDVTEPRWRYIRDNIRSGTGSAL